MENVLSRIKKMQSISSVYCHLGAIICASLFQRSENKILALFIHFRLRFSSPFALLVIQILPFSASPTPFVCKMNEQGKEVKDPHVLSLAVCVNDGSETMGVSALLV